MMIDRRYILVIVLLGILLAGAGYFGLLAGPSEPPREPTTPRHIHILFQGDVEAGQFFTMNGTLRQQGFDETVSRFGNVSLRLYAADGTLLEEECLGTVSGSTSVNLSIRHPAHPEYVIFYSPDFDTNETVEDFTVDYYYRQDDEYLPGAWAKPSDLPIDVTRHDPCAI